MKNNIVILSLICLMGVSMSCSNTRKGSSAAPANEGVEMKVDPERNGGAPQTVKLTVTNNTGHMIQFGAGYGVERLVDGKWVKHDLGNFPVISIMYTLPPQESGTYTINLFTERVDYPEGDYRIVKMISDGGNDSRPYYATFKVIEPR